MSKVLQATYDDGSLVLDEKLDSALEGKKLPLILIEDSESWDQADRGVVNDAERKRRFLEKLKTYSIKLLGIAKTGVPDPKFIKFAIHA